MQNFFLEYRNIIIFAHIISAVIWVGGMVAMRYAAHPSFMQIISPADRLEKISLALKKLFFIVLPFVMLLALTGAILSISYDIKHTDFHYLTHLKELIWGLMFINLMSMILRRNKADKAMLEGDFNKAREMLELIGKYMVPINIALGSIAIFLGATLRVYL
ncbi:MAG: hypothetical protein GXO30_00655 [Epsilonproteobacteria bacterium]|nr:hypothetical protein [Campylobacterota bacterium]